MEHTTLTKKVRRIFSLSIPGLKHACIANDVDYETRQQWLKDEKWREDFTPDLKE